MKDTAYFLTACLSFLSMVSQAGEGNAGKIGAPSKAAGTPPATLININRISSWYESNGEMERDPATGNSGLTYPRGTMTAIYAAGLLWGGKVNDGKTPVIRAGGSDYNRGVQPGAILGQRTGKYEDATDPNVRIWRIRRDFAAADLTTDAAEFFLKSISQVTSADIANLRAQYKKDWQEWPANKGAPFYDSNNDGIYSPQFDGGGNPKLYPAADEPGLASADQVIWFVCHDLAGPSQWASPSIGLEQQTTIWAYNREGALGNIAFKKFKLIYKGTATTPDTAKIVDMYLCHWSDPDLGDAGDDYVGCDTVLSMGYVYNSKSVDKSYKPYGIVTPAMGYDFLQGPIVPSVGGSAIFDGKIRPGYANLPMTSFIYQAAGSGPPGPIIVYQIYQMLRGLPPTPTGPPDPPPFVDPVTGQPTRYWLPGDPVTRTGWIDGMIDGPGDRRMLQSSGPFTMAVGDTQEVVVGVIGGIGDDYLTSINVMKQNDRTVQFVYDNLFKFIPPSFTATVSYSSSATATIFLTASSSAGAVTTITISLCRSDSSKVSEVQLYDDGAHNDGAANDGVFANSVTLTREQSPLSARALVSGIYQISALDAITTAGVVEVQNPVITFDNFNGDGVANSGEYIKFGFTLKNLTAFSLKNLRLMNPAENFITAYISALVAGGQTAIDGTAGFTSTVPAAAADSTFDIRIVIRDSLNNRWQSSLTFPIMKGNFRRDTVRTVSQNVVGNNDASIDMIVYNPTMVGQKYALWFGGSGTTRNWTLVNQLLEDDYATVSATMTAQQEVPAISNLPNAKGTGQFTINNAKSKITYDISVEGLSGTITGAHIHQGTQGKTGAAVKTLSFTGGTATGTWSKSDAIEPFADSLITDFTAGNLYVNIHTTANPNGEIRGQISDGLLPRENLPVSVIPLPPAINFAQEKKFIGFSLYVSPAPSGFKEATQTAPTAGNIVNTANPEGTYKLVYQTNFLLGPPGAWGGAKESESTMEMRFQEGENWAITLAPTPAATYFMRVPFAAYKDTIRVFPVITDTNGDTVWNTLGNPTVDGKPTWDVIAGVADTMDASGNIIKYYSPSFPQFPPTSSLWKGRLVNGVNNIARNIQFTNEKVDGIPPATGTTIQFVANKSVKIGDINTITLKLNSVREIGNGFIPSEFSLEQNYPNPFNPTTHLRFTIADSRFVILKIYDILGREVTTLVNETMKPGTYSVEWDASRFASGVYFYQLRAGSFVSVKKMMLIK